jgi:AraC-like DNA-binding protein
MLIRLSSRDVPQTESVSAFQDVFESIAKVNLDTLGDGPLRADVSLRLLPDLAIESIDTSPVRTMRTRTHIADGDDNLVLVLMLNTAAGLKQGRRDDVVCGPGEAFLWVNDEPGISHTPAPSASPHSLASLLTIAVPRAVLAPSVRRLNSVLMDKIVPASVPALSLLARYAKMLTRDMGQMPRELELLAAAHVHDLVSMALGATHDAAEIAKGRGVRAARFEAIKADIAARFNHNGFSIESVAARQGVSPQYIRALFNSAGTTFTDFVVEQRLDYVHRQLRDRRYFDRKIGSLALDAGFNDLSYFNRAFRRRFGMTPSEVRAAARESGI